MNGYLKQNILVRIAVTLGVIAGYRILVHIPVPYFSLDLFDLHGQALWNTVAGGNFYQSFSIAALGLMPFISATVLVELCSLFLPFLRRCRNGDHRGRLILKRYSLGLTAVLASVQAWFILDGLESMVMFSGTHMLVLENSFQLFVSLSTLVATVFVMLFLADMVTKHGIGNGVSVLLFAGIAQGLFENVFEFFGGSSRIDANFYHFLLFSTILSFAFIFLPLVLISTHRTLQLVRDTDMSVTADFPLNGCLSGREAISFAASVLMLPSAYLFYTASGVSLPTALQPGTVGYSILSCVCIIAFSYLLGWLFLHPRKRLARMKEWGWSLDGEFDSLSRIFILLNLPWTLYLCLASILPTIVITMFDVPMFLGGASLLMAAVIGLDSIKELRFRFTNSHGQITTIAELHDVHYAAMIISHLRSVGIEGYLQGYYHRLLLYFFGPYIPIRLMTPAAEKNRAEEIVKKYYGGLGI